jgi:hypothetical protein
MEEGQLDEEIGVRGGVHIHHLEERCVVPGTSGKQERAMGAESAERNRDERASILVLEFDATPSASGSVSYITMKLLFGDQPYRQSKTRMLP